MKKLTIALMVLLMLGVGCVTFAEPNNDNYVEIKNPNFDKTELDVDGTQIPTDWVLAGNDIGNAAMSIDTDAVSGNCLHIESSLKNKVYAWSIVVVEPNSYYEVSCMVRTMNVNGGSGANVFVIGADEAVSEGVFGTTEAWQEITLIGHTGSEQYHLKIGLSLGAENKLSSGEVWFDDVKVLKLTEVPAAYVEFSEPRTVASYENNNYNTNNQNLNSSATDQMPFIDSMLTALILTAAAAAVVYFAVFRKKKELAFAPYNDLKYNIVLVLLAAFAVRYICSMMFTFASGCYGYETDIKCFAFWGQRIVNGGTASFYSESSFADYPPAYMLVLSVCERIRLMLNIEQFSAAHCFILKLPSIICDIAVTYLVYKIAVKMGRTSRSAILLSCLVAFNPVVIFISSVWGQIDIILALFVALSLIILANGITHKSIKQLLLAGLFYGIAVALKPQALMVGPVFAMGYIMYIIQCIKSRAALKAVGITALAAVTAFAAIIIPSLPFNGEQNTFWLVDKYIGTATSYDYATIEAYNIYALLGANWTDVNETVSSGIMTYKAMGIFFMCLVIGSALFAYVKLTLRREKENNPEIKNAKAHGDIMLCAAYALAGIFTLGHYMHERYLFPAIILVFIAMLYYNDVRLFFVYSGFSISALYNTMGAFIIAGDGATRYTAYNTFMKFGAVITIAAFVLFTYFMVKSIIGNDKKYEMFSSTEINSRKNKKMHEKA